MRTVRVKFSEHEHAQSYSYKWDGDDKIEKGDLVIAESPFGGDGGGKFEDFEGFLKIVRVIEVVDGEDPRATKTLVGLVKLEAFLQARLDKKRNEKRRKKLRAEMDAKLSEARARKELEALANTGNDPEAAALLKELAELERS